MNKKAKDYLILASIVLMLAVVFILIALSSKITKNPTGTVGNSAGNLNNKGLFCESDGVVYFSNSNEGGCLYSMNVDESNVKKLNSQKVRNILAGKDYLYFFQTGASTKSGFGQIQGMKSFDRCKKNGKDLTALTKDSVVAGQLIDDSLFLLTSTGEGIKFYTMKTDKSNKKELSTDLINPASVQNGKIYYNGTDTNHYLYSLDPVTGTVSEVWRGNLWNPIVYGDYVFYMDVANNYRLCRYSLYDDCIEVLTNERVECFNLCWSYIYYQTNSKTPQLKCMQTDGTHPFVLADGIFTNINVTSEFVYFQPFGDETTTYHSPLGSNAYTLFQP